MDFKIISALIAGTVSIFVAFFSYIATARKIKLERKLFEKKIRHNYTEKLYNLRLSKYPKAFEITDRLGKKLSNKDENLPDIFKQIELDLRNWRSGEVSLILSTGSMNAYYDLIKCFKGKLALGKRYNNEQLQRIYNLRTIFRNELRNDIGLIYNNEEC